MDGDTFHSGNVLHTMWQTMIVFHFYNSIVKYHLKCQMRRNTVIDSRDTCSIDSHKADATVEENIYIDNCSSII